MHQGKHRCASARTQNNLLALPTNRHLLNSSTPHKQPFTQDPPGPAPHAFRPAQRAAQPGPAWPPPCSWAGRPAGRRPRGAAAAPRAPGSAAACGSCRAKRRGAGRVRCAVLWHEVWPGYIDSSRPVVPVSQKSKCHSLTPHHAPVHTRACQHASHPPTGCPPGAGGLDILELEQAVHLETQRRTASAPGIQKVACVGATGRLASWPCCWAQHMLAHSAAEHTHYADCGAQHASACPLPGKASWLLTNFQGDLEQGGQQLAALHFRACLRAPGARYGPGILMWCACMRAINDSPLHLTALQPAPAAHRPPAPAVHCRSAARQRGPQTALQTGRPAGGAPEPAPPAPAPSTERERTTGYCTDVGEWAHGCAARVCQSEARVPERRHTRRPALTAAKT